MLTIRRRRSTSLRHRRPASARSNGSRRDPKQLLACPWFTHATKQASASEAGSREGLPVDGGGVCGRARAFEAAGR